MALLGPTPLLIDDDVLQAARFDRAAESLAARGFQDRPRPGARPGPDGGSFVTYTNALFSSASDPGGRR